MSISSKLLDWLGKQAGKNEGECRRVELSLLQKNKNAQLLDLGCGYGRFTLRAGKTIGSKGLHGVEIVDEKIDKARERGIDVRKGDLNQKLPFQNESFDVIIASHIIEHLDNTDTFVKEIYRVLKPGGYLIIATPNLAACANILFLLFGKQPSIAEVSDHALVGTWSPRGKSVDRTGPAHRRIFTTGALRELLEHYGFRIETTAGVGFFPLPNQLARIMCRIDKNHASNIVIKATKPADKL